MGLTKNKNGKIVSKKASANGKKVYARIKGWTVAVTKARKALGVKGFLAVKKGTPCTRRLRSSTASEREKRMSDSYQRDGARSGKWGSPAACLSEGCLLV